MEHDLADPDLPRIPTATPGQVACVAAMAIVPAEQTGGEASYHALSLGEVLAASLIVYHLQTEAGTQVGRSSVEDLSELFCVRGLG